MTPAEAKARLLDWAQAADAESAARSSHPFIKAAVIGGGVLIASSILKKAGIKRIASLLFLTRGLPYILRATLKTALRSTRAAPAA